MMRKVAFLGSAALMTLALVTPASAQFRAALDQGSAAVNEGARSQENVDDLDDQSRGLLTDYRAALKETASIRRFNDSRRVEIQNQLEEIKALREDIANIQGLQRAIVPLLDDMFAEIQKIVEADTPFLMEERKKRIAGLKARMSDTTQTPASRYGLLMEAFQIENEYGRTLESYEGKVDNDGEALLVEYLRIGRIALIYKTPDNSILRIWDNTVDENGEKVGWIDLDKRFLPDVITGIRIANEQLPPDLMVIPVPAAQQSTQEQ